MFELVGIKGSIEKFFKNLINSKWSVTVLDWLEIQHTYFLVMKLKLIRFRWDLVLKSLWVCFFGEVNLPFFEKIFKLITFCRNRFKVTFEDVFVRFHWFFLKLHFCLLLIKYYNFFSKFKYSSPWKKNWSKFIFELNVIISGLIKFLFSTFVNRSPQN